MVKQRDGLLQNRSFVALGTAFVLGTRIERAEDEPHPTAELQHPQLALERFD